MGLWFATMTDFDNNGRDDLDEPLEDEERRRKKRPGEPFDRQRALRAVNRTSWWILSAAVAGCVVGLVVAKFVMPRSYQSTTVLRYEGTPSVFDGEPAPPPGEQLDSLITVFRIDPVVSEVKRQLDLPGENRRIVELMQIEHEFRSDTVFVTMPGDSPEGAARTVDVLARVFVDYHRDQEAARVDEVIASLVERIASATAELDAARRAYRAFSREHGIADLSTERLRSIGSAADLRARTDLAGSEIAALEARVAQLRGRAGSAPRASAGPSPEQRQLTRLEAELAAAQAQYSGDHPRVRSLELQVATLRARVSSGDTTPVAGGGLSGEATSVRMALSEAETDLAAARQRQEELGQQAQSAQQRVTQFSGIEGEATTLLARQQVAQTLVTDLQNRRAHLEDARRNISSGFRIMAAGSIPEWPEADKKRYLVAGGVPLVVLLLVVAAILFREFRGLRVRTAREAAWWGRGPVLGCTSWPREPDSLLQLIADLDDCVPTSKGHLLVVGATDEEAELAWHIVEQLNNDWMPSMLLDLGPVPPSEPLPIMKRSGSTAMALPKTTSHHSTPMPPMEITAWAGTAHGQALRRAARLADRVAVVVTSGSLSGVELTKVSTRLGRADGIGFILVGLASDLADLPDRVGRVGEFWFANRD